MKRRIIQTFSFFAINNHFHKAIYQGPLKNFCTPGLNCYACPLARFSCPMGSFQHFISIRQFPFYVLGFLTFIGVLGGRIACSFICPFGFFQELLYKIKTVKVRMPRLFSYIKYFMLVVVAIVIVWFTKEPWFCKLCPAGALGGGVPRLGFYPDDRSLIGYLFYMKYTILLLVIVGAVFIKRVFCRAMCPLGAMWGLMNHISLFKIVRDNEKCVQCGICTKVCPMDAEMFEKDDSFDCIRCMRCASACPQKAIKVRYGITRLPQQPAPSPDLSE